MPSTSPSTAVSVQDETNPTQKSYTVYLTHPIAATADGKELVDDACAKKAVAELTGD